MKPSIGKLRHSVTGRSSLLVLGCLLVPWTPSTCSREPQADALSPRIQELERLGKRREALQNLSYLANSVEAFLDRQHDLPPPAGAIGIQKEFRCELPEPVDWTPSGSPCDFEDHWFPGARSDWNAGTWEKFEFYLDFPHHYRYSVQHEERGDLVAVRLLASGDLDCDGIWSTISREKLIDPGSCWVEGSPAPTLDDGSLE